jgi:protein-disulfide isomerase-like protein with CxxC motif
MPVRSRRLAVATVITATAIAVPAAALASISGTSSGKPAPSAAASTPAPIKSGASQPAAATGSAAAIKSAARQALRNVTTPAMVAALATGLGVSHSAAQRAFNRLQALSGTDGTDPASPAFAEIARDLGVSPAQLDAALGAAKQAARQSVAGS